MASSADIFTLEVNGQVHRFQLIRALQRYVQLAREITHQETTGSENGRNVVVKSLHYELTTNASERLTAIRKVQESFKRLCKLDHPNVLPCIYAEVDENSTAEKFLTGAQIMEYSPNGDLSAYMEKSQGFTNEQVKHFSYQLLQGIHYLHSHSSITCKGIIHGDLKLQNTIVFADPSRPYGVVLRIMDLDHHATLKQTVTRTQDGKAVVGTKRYMSPEMILRTKIGRQTDIWSFGCIVLAMIYGHESFEFVFRDPGFTDPFDPMIRTSHYETVTEKDYRFHGGTTAPCIPAAVTETDCQDFLRSCLTVDLEKRARTETLLKSLWLSGENTHWSVENGPIPLFRHESWLDEAGEFKENEAQWHRGITCAGMLLMHALQSTYEHTKYQDFRAFLLQHLRQRPFGEKHQEMCIKHLAAVIPTLSMNERTSAEKVMEKMERNKAGNGTMRQFYPVFVSLQMLANCMNKFCSQDEQKYTVSPNLEWKAIKSSLDKKNPVICQVSYNEVDQDHGVLNRASMFFLRRTCPSKFPELDFVVVNGYVETVKGQTLIQMIQPDGQCAERTLSQFEAAWNWRASDPLMQKYLALENIEPASALFC